MRHLFDFIDPMRKGPLFHRYGWKGILFIIVATALCYAWFKGPHHCPLAGIFWFFTIGIHEAGHPIFRFLSGGNFMWSIWGGTLTEVGVPLLAYFCFLRQGKEIQADGCLFLLAVAFYSVGHYTGCSLDPVITLLNAGPETLPDWDYMHKWLGTEGGGFFTGVSVSHRFNQFCVLGGKRHAVQVHNALGHGQKSPVVAVYMFAGDTHLFRRLLNCHFGLGEIY